MFSYPYSANQFSLDRNRDSDHHLLRHLEPACSQAWRSWTITMAGSLTDKPAARTRSPPRVRPIVQASFAHFDTIRFLS